jgi:hypothetical protein
MAIMVPETQPASTPKWMLWTGWVLTVVPALALIASGAGKLVAPAAAAEASKDLGWTEERLFVLGFVEVGCAIVYLIPQTAVLGAILCTGYMGGAIATHARVGERFIIPIVFGMVIWGGVWLRDPRLRAILPSRG